MANSQEKLRVRRGEGLGTVSLVELFFGNSFKSKKPSHGL